MYYPEELVEEIRARNDIVDVISEYVRLQKKGTSYVGLCPFHNEKTPSFSVSRSKQIFHCFGCGAGGNVISFVMKYENYTFVEALKYLAQRAGIDLPEMEYSKEAKERADLRTMLLEINKVAAQYYYTQLKSPQGKVGLDYLVRRGISKEMQTAFGLGFSNKYPDDLYQFLQKKGYQTDAILQAGLIQVDERNGVYDKFWNRVMFPIMDVNHRVVGFGGRVMGDAKPKYLNSPETLIFNKSRTLYGLNRARTSKQSYFLLCEGYMDVIALHQAGYSNAVASLGTAFTSGHASMIKRYVQEVYLTYDSDEAGVKAALRAIPILRQEGILAKVIRLAPYKDPDEFLAKEGQEAFEQRIREARNGFLFSMDQLAKQFDFDSPEGKTAFFQACARRLIEFEDELERGNYLEAIAKHYKVSPESLQKLVTKTAISQGMATPTVQAKTANKPVKRRESAIVTSQKFLLTWMLDNDKIFAVVKKYITPKDFTEPLYQTVARLLYEQYDAGQLNPAKILNHFTEEEEHEEAASLFHTTLKELTTKEEKEQALRETLLRVKKHSLEEQTMHLDPADMAGLQRMMEEKRVLEEIKRLHISIE